jgi:hypothetical protein
MGDEHAIDDGVACENDHFISDDALKRHVLTETADLTGKANDISCPVRGVRQNSIAVSCHFRIRRIQFEKKFEQCNKRYAANVLARRLDAATYERVLAMQRRATEAATAAGSVAIECFCLPV